ncbi:MAG: SDR family oxidoreductase [Actinomycetota bacterium]|nr:SDR family oxidoreductase [Actinomycetota bacterium]
MRLAGCTALVTGASSGLGAAFAEELARRQANVVLVARSEPVLTATASRLHDTYGIRTDVIVQDLAVEGSAAAVRRRIDELGLRVDLLINNAGFATQGRFETIPAGRDHDQIMVNVTAAVDLTHALVPDMVAAGTGGIINVASLGGFQPAPYLAVYAATKAFTISFSQALAAELASRQIPVLALCPGPVDTAFFDVLGSRDAAIGQQLDAATVVAAALDALTTGNPILVPGWRNRLTAAAGTLLPRRLVLAAAERTTRRVITT